MLKMIFGIFKGTWNDSVGADIGFGEFQFLNLFCIWLGGGDTLGGVRFSCEGAY